MRIKTHGYEKARKRWNGYKQGYSPRNHALFRDASEVISTSISKNFEAEGRPEKWRKRKYHYDWPILWKTGRMRARAERSAYFWTHDRHRHINQIIVPFYGKYHHFGTKKLPVRKLIVLIEYDIRQLRNLYRKLFLTG